MVRILLIEPDAVLAAVLKTALVSAGHGVYCASTAQSAISTADEVRPDIVVMELQFVSHNGMEFLYEFRSYPDWQSIPVVVHSVVAAGEFAGSWNLFTRELGVSAYLYKPSTSLKKLLRTVGEYISAGSA